MQVAQYGSDLGCVRSIPILCEKPCPTASIPNESHLQCGFLKNKLAFEIAQLDCQSRLQVQVPPLIRSFLISNSFFHKGIAQQV